MSSLADLLMSLQDDDRYAGLGELPDRQVQSMPMSLQAPPRTPPQSSGLMSLLPLLMAQGSRGGGGRGGGPGGTDFAPPGRGVFGNDQPDPLGPNDPRLVTDYGVTLARPAMRSLRGIFGNRDIDLGGGYRTPQEQANMNPALAAPVGQSYHQEGLAIDLASQFQNARVARLLAQAGWNQFSPGGEPWHWSYGVTG